MGGGIVICIVAVLTVTYAWPEWTHWRQRRERNRQRRAELCPEVLHAERLAEAVRVPRWALGFGTQRALVALLVVAALWIPASIALTVTGFTPWWWVTGGVAGVLFAVGMLRRIALFRRRSSSLDTLTGELEVVAGAGTSSQDSLEQEAPEAVESAGDTWQPRPVPPPLYAMKRPSPGGPALPPKAREIYSAGPRPVVSQTGSHETVQPRRASGQ